MGEAARLLQRGRQLYHVRGVRHGRAGRPEMVVSETLTGLGRRVLSCA